MDFEIKIGRDVEGTNVCRVPSTYSKVSRSHATLRCRGGIVTLEDNGSSNGTYVNGSRITACQVSENDTVWLGGNGTDGSCYRLDLKQLLAPLRGYMNAGQSGQPQQGFASNGLNQNGENGGRGDYSLEFERLKQAYIGYHDELSKLTKKANTRMQLPRVLLSMIPALLSISILLISKDMTVRIVAMSAGGLLSTLLATLTMGRGNSKKEKLNEDIMDLQLKYQNDYKCPKCGKKYNLDLHWKKLQAEGKCPYGCGAKFN